MISIKQYLFVLAAVILLTGCTAASPEDSRMESYEEYCITVVNNYYSDNTAGPRYALQNLYGISGVEAHCIQTEDGYYGYCEVTRFDKNDPSNMAIKNQYLQITFTVDSIGGITNYEVTEIGVS